MYNAVNTQDQAGTESIDLTILDHGSRSDSLTSRCTRSGQSIHETQREQHQNVWFEVLLRALGLGILLNVATKVFNRPREELPKQAMCHNRWLSSLVLMTHLIPISACIVLLFLNLRGYYIGGVLTGHFDEDLKFAGLQFAAKLHELFMQASLSLVVVSFLRHELVFGEGIPFGAVFGSLQFSNIAYLWSKEFAGTLSAPYRNPLKKWRLVGIIVIGSILAVTVGPSSAIAMRPRSEPWPAGGSSFYLNASSDEIWPTVLDDTAISPQCANVSLDMNCLSGPEYTLSGGLLPFLPSLKNNTSIPDTFTVGSPRSIRNMYTTLRIGLYAHPWTQTTTTMSILADAVAEIGRLWISAAIGTLSIPDWKYSRRFYYRKNVVYTIKNVQQPITSVFCSALRDHVTPNSSQDGFVAPNMELSCNNGSIVQHIEKTSPWISQLDPYFNATSPTLRFIHFPTDSFGLNSVGVLIVLPSTWPGGKNIIGCGVDARWAPAFIQSDKRALGTVWGWAQGWDTLGLCGLPKSQRITVTPEWANYLNPVLAESNLTVFQSLLNTIPDMYDTYWERDASFVAPIMESIISVLFTNGLARTSASAVPQGVLKGCSATECTDTCEDGQGAWCKEIMPKSEFGYGGSIYNLPTGTDTSRMTKLTAEVDIEGYAYSPRGASMKLACIALAVYTIITMIHIGFTLGIGLTSQAWDTVSEVTALAMQSQPTRILRNTCAGISTTNTFTHIVKIVQTGENGEHLELDFGDDPDHRKQPLTPNEFYG